MRWRVKARRSREDLGPTTSVGTGEVGVYREGGTVEETTDRQSLTRLLLEVLKRLDGSRSL